MFGLNPERELGREWRKPKTERDALADSGGAGSRGVVEMIEP